MIGFGDRINILMPYVIENMHIAKIEMNSGIAPKNKNTVPNKSAIIANVNVL